MIEMPSIVGDVVRSVGLSTAMKAAGVVTGLLPIPQPMLLVRPGASRRLGQALCGKSVTTGAETKKRRGFFG